MDLLTAVNRLLPALGEHPVTRVDAKHPTLAIILPVIQAKLDETLLRGWWFNEYDYTLYPSPEGGIELPDDTLSFVGHDVRASVRGRNLFNPETMSFKWTAPVKGRLMLRLSFDELPESVASLVFYSALVQAYLTDIGLEAVLQEWDKARIQAERLASTEHLRNMKHSTRKSARYGRYRSALRG